MLYIYNVKYALLIVKKKIQKTGPTLGELAPERWRWLDEWDTSSRLFGCGYYNI